MSMLARAFPRGAEKRAEWGSSAIPSPTEGWNPSYSSVDLRHSENALQKVAVRSASDLIASLCASLPLDTYRRNPDGTKTQVDNPKIVQDPGGEGYGAADWIYQYLMSKLLRGNAYGREASPDPKTGYPTQVVLYHPDDVVGWRDQNGAVHWQVSGRPATGAMWHKRAYPMAGCLLGGSPIAYHATTIGEGIAAARFGYQFFSDGGHPMAMLTNSETEINQTVATEVKARWMTATFGKREPVVYGKGWDYKPISVTPEESQFLETQKYTAAECCRIYGPCIAEILGYETGGSMTYQNVEQRSIDLLKFAINRWLVDLEYTFTDLTPRGQFVKFNRGAILQTDLLTRYRAYLSALAGRFVVPSEIRHREDWAPFTPEQEAELEAMAALGPTVSPIAVPKE